MNSFMTFIQEKLTPIANFFGAQRHFSAMQKGFMATVSFILVSAIFMIPFLPIFLLIRLFPIVMLLFSFSSPNKDTTLKVGTIFHKHIKQQF